MDRRTIFLQELMQVSDLLQMQRHVMRSLGATMFSLMGGRTFATLLPSSTTPSSNNTIGLPTATGLQASVPPIALYQLNTTDTAWSTLGSDTTPLMMQGLNWTAKADSSLLVIVPTGSNKRIDLIQASLTAVADTNSVVLPYYPLIQTTTTSGSSTTTLNLTSSAGMSIGDQIIVSGVATANGNPTYVNTVPNSTSITLTNALASSPGSNVTVRDVSPNSGNPLSGPANSGTAQNIDRVYTVSLQIKPGAPTTGTPTIPQADSGWVGLWNIGSVASPILNGTTDISAMFDYARDTSGVINAPFWPGLIPASGQTAVLKGHHHGTPGQAPQIDLTSEASYVPVNKTGDTMTGELIMNSTAGTAGFDFSVKRTAPTNETRDGLKLTNKSGSSILDLVSTLGLRWVTSGGNPATQGVQIARVLTGSTAGASTVTVTTPFTPICAIAMEVSTGTSGGVVPAKIWFLNNTTYGTYLVVAGGTLNTQNSTSGKLTSTGFTIPSFTTINVDWMVWG